MKKLFSLPVITTTTAMMKTYKQALICKTSESSNARLNGTRLSSYNYICIRINFAARDWFFHVCTSRRPAPPNNEPACAAQRPRPDLYRWDSYALYPPAFRRRDGKCWESYCLATSWNRLTGSENRLTCVVAFSLFLFYSPCPSVPPVVTHAVASFRLR